MDPETRDPGAHHHPSRGPEQPGGPISKSSINRSESSASKDEINVMTRCGLCSCVQLEETSSDRHIQSRCLFQNLGKGPVLYSQLKSRGPIFSARYFHFLYTSFKNVQQLPGPLNILKLQQNLNRAAAFLLRGRQT
ncbi:hypothetical protein AMECASPLE_011584 [Ameca splendens]|uniref:Uncharacterized protein n=1 Tax=Ameca splendens TaxID=208324 RepID=A0ABV1A868_9TELE